MWHNKLAMDIEPEETLPCAEKLVFDDEEAAIATAAVVRWQHGSELRPYHCRYCGLWHLASA